MLWNLFMSSMLWNLFMRTLGLLCYDEFLILLMRGSPFFSFTEHPWISFYTAPTLKTCAIRPRNNNVRSTSRQLTSTQGKESERKRLIYCNPLSDDSSSTLASDSSTEVVDGESGGLVDVLTVAISRVRISEPKRSRICSPSRAIQQECSSNLTTSNLCTAFWI